jgi:cytidylate kinase
MPLPEMIAIDGPAASGKTTVGERLARIFGYLLFDTGVMYRAVTWAALQDFGNVADEQKVTELANRVVIDLQPPSVNDGRQADVLLDGKDITWEIRSPEVDANVSPVSAYRGVRQAMSAQQRRIGLRGKVVMVGRDIGTVVLPEAELKLYLDASAEVRARRRYLEILNRGGQADYAEILAGLRRRDQIDSSREVAPLKPASDAVVIDTDQLSIDEVVDKVLGLIDP